MENALNALLAFLSDVLSPSSTWLSHNFLFFLAFVIAILGIFLLQGLRRIPAEPPHVAILTVFGQRKPSIKKEGWRFFPIYPWWHGFVLVNVTKVNQDLPEQKIRTPDLAELNVPVSVTWIPNKKEGEQLIDFLNSGGEKGVRTILEDVIHERLREWAISFDEGPADWQDAMGSREEAAAVLLKAILGDELKQIPSDIPTPILLRYFARPTKYPTNDRDKQRWGEKWDKLEAELLRDLAEHRLTKEQLETLVGERRRQVQTVRQGNGEFNKIGLGIFLLRLNVGEIKPLGKLAEAAELKAKEKREREAEILELDHVAERVQALNELGFSNEQALEIIQTERGKVRKEIKESKWNISQETRAMIEKIGSEIIENIVSRK